MKVSEWTRFPFEVWFSDVKCREYSVCVRLLGYLKLRLTVFWKRAEVRERTTIRHPQLKRLRWQRKLKKTWKVDNSGLIIHWYRSKEKVCLTGQEWLWLWTGVGRYKDVVYQQHNINWPTIEKKMSVAAGNPTQAATTNPTAASATASSHGKGSIAS